MWNKGMWSWKCASDNSTSTQKKSSIFECGMNSTDSEGNVPKVFDIFTDRTALYYARLQELQDCNLHVPYMQAQVQALEREILKKQPKLICTSVQCSLETSETGTQCVAVQTTESAVSNQYSSTMVDVAVQCSFERDFEEEQTKAVCQDAATQTPIDMVWYSQGIQTEEVDNNNNIANDMHALYGFKTNVTIVGDTSSSDMSIQNQLVLSKEETSLYEPPCTSVEDNTKDNISHPKRRGSKIPIPVSPILGSPVITSTPSVSRLSQIPVKLGSHTQGVKQQSASCDSIPSKISSNTNGCNGLRTSRSLLPIRISDLTTQFNLIGSQKSMQSKIEKECSNMVCVTKDFLETTSVLRSVLPKKTHRSSGAFGTMGKKEEFDYDFCKAEQMFPSPFGKICLQVIELFLLDKPRTELEKTIPSQRVKRELFEMLNHKMDILEISNAIHAIRHYANTEVLEYVLGLQDSNGNTALHLSILGKHFDVMSLLIASCPFTINKQNYAQETPLILAVKEKNLDAVEELVHFGADLNHQDGKGMTALMYARQLHSVPIAKFILSCLDINV